MLVCRKSLRGLCLILSLSFLSGLQSSQAAINTDFQTNTIPRRSWINDAKPVSSAMLCIHGLGLNSSSYDDFARRLADRGVAVYAIDVRGFGEWMKEKGKTKIDFKQCFKDIEKTLTDIRALHPNAPVYLTGESMGGAIVLHAASQYPHLITALISSVPASSRYQEKKTDVKVALHALEGPHKDFNEGKQVIDQATKKDDERLAWSTDPLDRMDLSPLDLLQFQELCDGNHESAKDIKSTPVLVLQGNQDHLIKPKGTFELFRKIATPDKTLMVLGNTEHLVLELEQFGNPEPTFNMIWTWMQRYTKDGSSTNQMSADH